MRNPKIKQLTLQQEHELDKAESYSIRSSILIHGIAKMLDSEPYLLQIKECADMLGIAIKHLEYAATLREQVNSYNPKVKVVKHIKNPTRRVKRSKSKVEA